MNQKAISDKLVTQGQILFDAPKETLIKFTGIPGADALLNDLQTHPHAFVLACLMDRQIAYEKAWLIPYTISEKLGTFSIEALAKQSREDVKVLMSKPGPLHRFSDKMSGVFYSAIQRIITNYQGDASQIWTGEPSSAEAIYRLLRFDGAGPKIATMAVNILAREFKIKFADHFSVDISADVHVCRVFARLGLCPPEPEPVQVVYKARAILDSPCWEIGKNWCRPRLPLCDACYMTDLCPTSKGRHPIA
jgi:endonuclease III